jgi:sugar lactone lactonase YvrE
MLKTRILSVKIFSFALMLLIMFMVSGFLLHYPAAIAAEPDATAGSGYGAQMGYWLGDGNSATSAGLNFPEAVAVYANGNIYIADRDNNRIREVAAVTTIQYGISMTAGNIYTVAGNGTEGNSGDGGPASCAELAEPYGVAVDNAGNIFIADSMNAAVRKVDPKGIITTIAGKGVTAGIATAGSGFSGDGGPATNAELSSPEAITIDRAGDIFIADTYNLRIREVAAVTAIQYGIPMTAGNIYTVAGNGQGGFLGGYSGDGGPATSAELAQPYGVAVDTSGNIYIADQNNFRIRKVDSKGIITTVAGGGATIPSTSAGIVPFGLAVDRAGDLYIAGDNCILKLDTAADTITTMAGNGTSTASGQLMAIFTVGRPSYALGRQTYSMDAVPFISNGRLLVPVRFLADALGARTDWDPAKQQATITRVTRGFIVLELTIGSAVMESTSGYGNTAGTGKTIQMDMAPVIVNGRTYLPVRYVAEAFGFDVSWGAAAQTITLSQKEPLGSPQAAATS